MGLPEFFLSGAKVSAGLLPDFQNFFENAWHKDFKKIFQLSEIFFPSPDFPENFFLPNQNLP